MFVKVFLRVRHHYDAAGRQLALEGFGQPRLKLTNVVVLPVASLHRGTVFAIEYAGSLRANVRAVHVVPNEEQLEALRCRWQQRGIGVWLVGLASEWFSRRGRHPIRLRHADPVRRGHGGRPGVSWGALMGAASA
ncbi:MAG: hypothetical protein H5T86_06575 [Armatimonadetes bacterium]|nr:hypothetical protein [Armatimonadota bacterium]